MNSNEQTRPSLCDNKIGILSDGTEVYANEDRSLLRFDVVVFQENPTDVTDIAAETGTRLVWSEKVPSDHYGEVHAGYEGSPRAMADIAEMFNPRYGRRQVLGLL